MPTSLTHQNNQDKQFEEFTLANSVRGKALTESITKSMKDISDFLSQFNGAYALNAATVGQTEHTTIDQFTKDGVTILSRLAATKPEEELCRRLIEFIGKRVDARCHDGTTTSMMMSSTCCYRWMQEVADLSRKDRHLALKIIDDFILKMTESVDKYSFTVKELIAEVTKKNKKVSEEDIRKRIFYDTVMTSSKGDTELAEKLTEVLVSLPEELYSYTSFEHSNLETKDRFLVVSQEADFQLRGNIQSNTTLLPGNKFMGTAYEMEKAYLVVTGNEVLDGSPEAIFLQQWIYNRYMPTSELKKDEKTGKTEKVIVPPVEELDRPLVILSRNAANGNLVNIVNLYNNQQKDWNKKIFMYQFYGEIDNSYPAFAKAIAAVAQSDECEDYLTLTEALNYNSLTNAMIPCKFYGFGNTIEISNLYKRDGRKFHPFYYNKNKIKYHDLIEEMQNTIENQSKRHLDVNKRMERFTKDVIYIMRCMICQEIKELRIGSTTHELFNNTTVVEDALGSAMSVVEDGVIMSGYQKILKDLLADNGSDRSDIELSIKVATTEALSDVIKSTYVLTDDEFNSCSKSLVKFNNRKNIKYMYNNAFDKAPYTPRDAVKELASGTSNAIFQPVVGFKEQLLRIRDIISKVIRTYAVLTNKQYMTM